MLKIFIVLDEGSCPGIFAWVMQHDSLAYLNRVRIYKVMHHNTLDLNQRVIRMSGEPLFEFVMVNFGLNKGQCLSLKWKIRTEVRTEGAPSGEK